MSNIVIVGSGPAGVSAALYAVRAGGDTTVLTKGPGALDRAEKIENYYGLAQPVSGAELERRSIETANRLGVRLEFKTGEWLECRAMLEQGEADVLLGLEICSYLQWTLLSIPICADVLCVYGR